MAIFSHYRSIRILTQGSKPKMEYFCTSRRISIETWKKELNGVFSEKRELQLLGISIFVLFGVSSMWEFPNDMFQQIYLRNKLVFLNPRETWIVKKTDPKKLKDKSLITYLYV